MHSDPAAIKKSIRSYLMIGAALFVCTVITVAVPTRFTSPCRWRSPWR